jgi:hypothetical protein
VTKAKDERPPEELSEQELEETNGEQLPERQAMTLIRGVEPLPFPIVPDDGAPIVIDDPHPT